MYTISNSTNYTFNKSEQNDRIIDVTVEIKKKCDDLEKF